MGGSSSIRLHDYIDKSLAQERRLTIHDFGGVLEIIVEAVFKKQEQKEGNSYIIILQAPSNRSPPATFKSPKATRRDL